MLDVHGRQVKKDHFAEEKETEKEEHLEDIIYFIDVAKVEDIKNTF